MASNAETNIATTDPAIALRGKYTAELSPKTTRADQK